MNTKGSNGGLQRRNPTKYLKTIQDCDQTTIVARILKLSIDLLKQNECSIKTQISLYYKFQSLASGILNLGLDTSNISHFGQNNYIFYLLIFIILSSYYIIVIIIVMVIIFICCFFLNIFSLYYHLINKLLLLVLIFLIPCS